MFETIPNIEVGGTLGYYLRGESSAPVGQYFAIVAADFGHSALLDGIAAKLTVFGSDVPNESATNHSNSCLYPSGTLGVNVKDGEKGNIDSVILDVYELDYGADCECYMASVSTGTAGVESISANPVFPKSRPSSFTLPFYYLRQRDGSTVEQLRMKQTLNINLQIRAERSHRTILSLTHGIAKAATPTSPTT